MTKKEFMLQLIAFLPDWKMGWGLKPLIENNMLSPDAFEQLYQIFREVLHSDTIERQKYEFKERLQQIEAMQKQEAQKTQEELVDLEAMFDTL